jgi:hypothetical protein
VINDEVDAATIAMCEGETLLARWSYTSNSSDDISHPVYSWGQLMLRGDGVLFERTFLRPGEYDPWRDARDDGPFTVDDVERIYGDASSKTFIVRIVLPPEGPVTEPENLPAQYHSDVDGVRYVIIDVEDADLSDWRVEVGQSEIWRKQAGFGGWTPERDDSTSVRGFDREHAWYRSGKGSQWSYLRLSQDRTEYPWSALVDHDEHIIRWIDPNGATLEPKPPVSQATEPMNLEAPSQVDLSWHPETYFWPPGLEKQLLAKVKGAARRAALQRLIDEGRLVEIPNFLATAGLSDDERTEIGRVHPHFMGGEYLPDQDEDEIEIARIEINSTTGDVTSVYAHQDGSTIRYRVVDEYGGETLQETTERTSSRPLTLGELEEFFLGAWPFLEVLEMNFEDDTEQMLGFFRGASQFYPEFDQLLRQRVIAAYPESAQAEEEHDSGDGRILLGDREIPGGEPEDDVIPAEVDQLPMNHRFAIFPAGSVASIDQANDLIHTMGAQSDGEPSAEIRDLIDEVLERAEWTFSLTRPADSRGVIIATHRPEDGVLRFLLTWTMFRGLAVYDIELFRLYDPSGRVDVEVSLPGGVTLPYLTPPLLRDLVLRPTWPDPEYPYFIVKRCDGVFIQVYRDEDGKYQFEHRDGGPDAHSACRTADTGLIADVMWAWATEDASWRTAVPWSQMKFEDEGEGKDADEASLEPDDDGIYVDTNSDRAMTFDDTEGEPFLAYHASNADNDKDAEGRLIPTGWVLHVGEDESFVTEVLDFDSLDEALVRAAEHLEKSLPDSSSRPVLPMNEDVAPKRAHVFLYSGQLPVDPYGHEHDLTVSASYSVADGLTINRSDSTQYPMDDLEDLWQIAPEHVDHLREALGAVGHEDVLDLLAQRYAEGSMPTHLSGWLDGHGVTYSHVTRSLPN